MPVAFRQKLHLAACSDLPSTSVGNGPEEHYKNKMIESDILVADIRCIDRSTIKERIPQPLGADGWLTRGMRRGRLHEIFAVEQEEVASGAGFAVALALCSQATPLLWLRTEDGQHRAGRIHASGLADLGLDADSFLLGLVPDEAALLRAAADAARCSGLGTVLIEAWGRAPAIDLTVSRRLMLAAERSGVTVLMLRVGTTPVPSAAETRWGVSAGPSIALEANAPGAPCFEIELLRQRGGPAGKRWRVEWNRDQKTFRAAPLSGAGVPLAVDRPAAGQPAASVRHTA